MLTSLDADLKKRQDGKYSVERETEARQWISAVVGEPLEGEFGEALKDGIMLCKLASKLSGKSLRHSTSKLGTVRLIVGFKQMENIHSFLVTIADMGVRPFETFQTVDLFEAKNLGQVVDCIFAVSRTAEKNGFQGPRLGPRLATSNERTFTSEQLAASKTAVPLLTAFNKGASQSGMTFGGKRQIGGKYESYGNAEAELDTSSSKGLEMLNTRAVEEAPKDSNSADSAADSVLDLIDEHLKAVSET